MFTQPSRSRHPKAPTFCGGQRLVCTANSRRDACARRYWPPQRRSPFPYGKQAVCRLDYNATTNDIVIQAPYDKMDREEYFKMLKTRGVRIVAPPMPALLAVRNGKFVPSALAGRRKIRARPSREAGHRFHDTLVERGPERLHAGLHRFDGREEVPSLPVRCARRTAPPPPLERTRFACTGPRLCHNPLLGLRSRDRRAIDPQSP